MDVSRETEELLTRYGSLIRKWNRAINLVAPASLPDLRRRHIDDSLQLSQLLNRPKGTWLDIGSGGGLPGVVLAIVFRDCDLRVILLESDQRKCAFLRSVKRELSLTNMDIIAERIEDAPPVGADYVSARALAPLANLLPFLVRHMLPSGEAYFLKGRSWRDELRDVQDDWRFKITFFPSITDPNAAILKISEVTHVHSADHRNR
ncbi:MAG: 16S rRNA (guanine(527)-N(7))-methyltransferase RsmG [Paracoccus sp. (in: a-proteobacteria)]|nr:16S rRNA (guanine(527)-N(7))-methyltransferase RsmG [Paracoccus sp. (in: a-proteobacteria)]